MRRYSEIVGVLVKYGFVDVASQFAGDPSVRFPRICWPLSTPAVLMMEFLDGVKVSAVGTERHQT